MPTIGPLTMLVSVIVLACAAALAAADDSKLEQMALNLAAEPTQMEVTFASWTDESSASCNYGTSRDQLTRSVSASGSKYKLDAYTSPMLFKATLDGLEVGNKVYYYSCGSEALGYSAVEAFKSHPGVGVEDVTFYIYGDVGQTDNSADTMRELVAKERLLGGLSGGVISAGDLSYANGDEPLWDSFGQLRQNASASNRIPTMTTLGNHEWFDDSHYAFTAYLARFDNPPAATTGQRELYYSNDIGLVHWVMVAGYCTEMRSTSTQPCLAQGSPQMKWLQADLAGVDRSKTPWVVVVFHQPYMNSNTAHNMAVEGHPMQKAIEDTLYEYKVDLVFSGHVHAYERSCAVYQYKCTPGAPTYITIGDGGNLEGLATGWIEPQPEWSNYRLASYGFGALTAVDASTLTWRWHQNLDLLPAVADEFTLTKGALRGEKPAQVTGVPTFADSPRGRHAAGLNDERTKAYQATLARN
ncbi:Metallo-dependent phosphatase-like protein [Ochromonadaceae sp. CCMP2298]|nr:Metallo-dependent phosphatase-like protein [Ochromonadaceae sp. CCMP2298]